MIITLNMNRNNIKKNASHYSAKVRIPSEERSNLSTDLAGPLLLQSLWLCMAARRSKLRARLR